MKTIPQIVDEMIRENQSLANGHPNSLLAISQIVARQKEREKNDPAIAKLIVYFASALASAMTSITDYNHRVQMISGTMMQAVMMWEDANIKFEKQIINPKEKD